MSQVLNWIKSHIFIVVFAVLMIAALVTMPILAKGMNQKVRDEVETRARKASDLKGLPTQVDGLPGMESKKILINKSFLEEYEAAAKLLSEDAEIVVNRALEHNQKGRSVMLPALLPKPQPERLVVLLPQFYEMLAPTYESLLLSINAGTPPSEEAIHDALDRREAQTRQQVFQVHDDTDELTEEQARQLKEELTQYRLAEYAERAGTLAMYADIADLAIPTFIREAPQSLGEVYNDQWTLWLRNDMFRALYSANEADRTLLNAPIKRVLSIRPWPISTGASSDAGSSRGKKSGGGASVGERPNRKQRVEPDFSTSLTGRKTNSLYDVRNVTVSLIVDSTRIPKVLDAIAAYNFMTVLEVRVSEADPFADAARGYLYGPAPVSRIDLDIETIWLREWTIPFMPDETRNTLGIPLDTPAEEAA